MTLKIGDRVLDYRKKNPISTGRVVAISLCGRYATIEKTYGARCCWREHRYIEELRALPPPATQKPSDE